MEELLLLRHGKSDWRVSSSDFNRPLKKRGRRGATRIGQWLRDHDLIPDLIIASPAVRADATARRCAAAMGLKTSVVVNDGRLYLADLNTLLELLSESSVNAQRVMLVGHNPGLEELLIHLLDGIQPDSEDGKLLPTATVARLKMANSESSQGWQGSATLLSLVRARQLEATNSAA
ncbi:hypothetical protein BOW53_13625 [Solemya pervernicosa gill symbiont]|uniref:Phosphohistidine phosphatase SixA n=1 Tax=Solemya pervernicosa gill symbiont TaxID=642797 RepID=A0A1T2L1P6_9GAMM|nr:histidine phosphatase family protein [Solemya pervernicosa gill symbiont]OOZ38940.1 hypothetical protein BOW53_13625 [Solemya pervernicosa gill symbiont]